jgi:bifunctional oligoribonuclease and PAP phosphatase NrnA
VSLTVPADPGAELDPDALATAAAWLRAAASARATVVLAAHVGPDGDALGTMLALHLALTRLGARTLPTVGEEPLRIPAPLAELPGVGDLVTQPQLPPASEVELLVTADAASPERLGTVARYLDDEVRCIVLDHHATGTPFGDVRLVAPTAAATAQVAVALLDRLGVELTSDIATCLYAGLVTDTGRFGFATTDRAAMELGGRLLEAGVEHADLVRRLYDTRSLGELKLVGRALDRLTFVPDVALVHTHLTHDELAAAGSGLEATEAIVDLLRSVDVAEVSLLFKPDPNGHWRASMRSRGTIDVGRIAAAMGGGGHAFAAGFTADGAIAELVERVISLLREG